MVSLWQVLGFACMATLSSAFSVDNDCTAMGRHEAKLHGTNAHINAWILDTNDILLITLGYGKGHPYYYDYIEIKPKDLVMKKVRVDEETIYHHINLTQPLDSGWVDINFYAEEQYKFNFTSQNVHHELPGESKMKLTKFTVEGSNVTVNCKSDTAYWKILKDSTYIPLNLNSTNSFSLFSRSDFHPTLTAGNSSIKLGIIDNVINNIQHIKKDYQSPLPRFKEHIVQINCVAYQHCTCTYILGIDGAQKIKKRFLKCVTSLAIHGDGAEFLVKLNRMKPKEVSKNYTTTPLPPAESNNGIMIVLIVLILLLVIALPTTALLIYRILNKQHEEQNEKRLEEVEELKQLIEKTLIWDKVKIQTRLWDAVVNNNQPLVEHLLESGKDPVNKDDGLATSPLEEAHLRGNKDLVKMFANKRHSKHSVPTKDQIKLTLKELEKRMGQVFEAAKYGQYERDNGVNALLNTQSLPGTIIDSNGWSLIHHMATAKFPDDCPAWDPADIGNFIDHHVIYINAIDHWGNTALHFLAQRQGSKDTEHHGSKNVKWGGQTISVEKAWLEMAKLFISHECDPRIPNHKNELPHELAKDNGNYILATYLEQKFEDLEEIDHESAADKFEELVEAARKNRFSKIIKLLKAHVPLLPIAAERDPLVEAIRNGHPRVVFLLICAGTPLCNCSINDLTPLEAAHHTLGLPALFPALMRKVYSDRLQAEKDKITQLNDLNQSLAIGIENIKTSILENGDESKWKFESKEVHFNQRSEEARKLLVAASGLGLSLTVQLLGLEDVELRPLPNEKSPVDEAQIRNHLNILYVLCRDLKMAPYKLHKKDKILKRLESEMLISECKIFKKCTLDAREKLLIGLEEQTIDNFLKVAIKEKKSDHEWSLYNNDIFYIFAKYGLIYLLDEYMQINGKSKLDQIVQEFSGCTMLHISVLYGQQHITQYLLYHEASSEKTTISGYTAAHIAAVLGYKHTMNYILSYKVTHTEVKCSMEMTATELIDQYDKMRKRCNYPVLSSSDSRNVKNEIGEKDMALEILRKKTNQMDIQNKVQLIEEVKKLHCKKNDMETSQVEYIISETKAFFKDIGGNFRGNLNVCGPYAEDNSMFHNNIVQFTLELETFSAQGSSKNIDLDVKSIGDNIKILKINNEPKDDTFLGNNFMKSFIKVIKDRIHNYKSSNEKVKLCPPFLIPYECGVELCWASHSNIKFQKVKSYVDLVIKADLPEINGFERLPENKQGLCGNVSAELHVTNLKGDWTYRGYSLETQIFGNLSENERIVWLICRFIKLISRQYWLVPTSNIRKIVHTLDTNYVGVTFPRERALKAQFLKELAENPDQWGQDDIFDRVIGIYRRFVTADSKGNIRPVVSVKSFLMPTSYTHKLTESVCGVIRYLEGLN